LIGGAVLFHQGAITVNVKEKRPEGDRVYVIAPATLATWGVKLIPDKHFPRLPEEARHALPAATAALQELDRLPDFVLVEVENAREYVRVEKVGDKLVFDVDSDREEVHISVPIRAARATVEELLVRNR
jgi:hypothetical protein